MENKTMNVLVKVQIQNTKADLSKVEKGGEWQDIENVRHTLTDRYFFKNSSQYEECDMRELVQSHLGKGWVVHKIVSTTSKKGSQEMGYCPVD